MSFSCLWKLLGEALLTMHALPKEVAMVQVPSIILNDVKDNAEDNTTIMNKSQALKMSSKAFLRALQIEPENVSCWHDLALSFHYRLVEQDDDQTDLKDPCFRAIRKALALKPKDHALWNVLGVFAAHHQDMALAQHAFIRSITLLSNAVAWSNLGIMYFMQG